MDETKPEDTTNQEPAPEAAGVDLDQAAPDYAARAAELEGALAEERARGDKLLDQSQRMAAEFQNSRRRLETQVQDEIERASTHLLRRLLPVIDDFDLAFAHTPAEFETASGAAIGAGAGDGAAVEAGAAWVEGFRRIQKKLHTILGDEGVEIISGEGLFDPALHEAVSGEPSDAVPSGHIIGTLRAGYTYKGKVLRPALVRVAI